MTTKSNNIAELSGLIRSGTKSKDKIVFITEYASIARKIFNLTKEVFHFNPEVKVRQTFLFKEKYLYMVKLNNSSLIREVLSLYEVPKSFIISDEEQKRSYLRGLFLSVGSITDPKTTRYHLEFNSNKKPYAKFVQELLNEFNLNAKIIKRENRYMIYIKESEKIGDFLRIIDTPLSLFYFEDIRIYRDHKNTVNRLNNCDQANIEKQIQSANEHIENIKLIKNKVGLEFLDNKLHEIAVYRVKYPEETLNELAQIITVETKKKISKSGVYHRLNKIKEIANKIKEEEQ